MSDLKFVAREGDYLVFETTDGIRHRAPLEDGLRDALRRSYTIQPSDLAPAEIQKQIRAGKTVAELASEYSISVESIEPFAVPILDELRYLLQSALTVQIADGPIMTSFEELVQRTLPNPGWKIFKQDGRWIISAADSAQSASWYYQPQSRTLEPKDALAKTISRLEGKKAELIPPRPTVLNVVAQEEVTVVKSHPASGAELKQESDEPAIVESAGASVLDLVAQLRQRRSEENKPASAKGRAPLPSWDEIVSETNSETDSN